MSSLYKLSAISLAACMSVSAAWAANATHEPLRIGATMSQTGTYATQGVAARNGYLLCEQDLNAAGGVLGRQVEFVLHDDESDTELVQTLYRQLIEVEHVDLILGPYGSTLTEALAAVTEEYQMVHISPLAAATSIWEQGHEYLFMVLPPAELFLGGLIDMAEQQGLSQVAVLYEDVIFPAAAAAGAREAAERRGMQVRLFEAYQSGADSFSEFVQALDDQGVEVLAMAASNLSDFITLTRELQAHDINLKMFGTSGAVQQFADELGETTEYVYGLSAWEPSAPNPSADEFTAAYTARFGQAPAFHSAGAYASCQLLAQAVESVNSLQQDAIRDALLNLETTTVFGDFAVDKRGYQTAHQGLFIQWQDGEKVVVWPAEVATHHARYPTPEWSKR